MGKHKQIMGLVLALIVVTAIAFLWQGLRAKMKSTEEISSSAGMGNELVSEAENIELPESEEQVENANEETKDEEALSSAEETGNAATHELLVPDIQEITDQAEFSLKNRYVTHLKGNINEYWIDDQGILWGTGTSLNGELGFMDNELTTFAEPQKIAEHVIHVAYDGAFFVVYLTDDGCVYGMGGNVAGILDSAGSGMRNRENRCCIPEPVLLFEDAAYVTSSSTQITILTNSGSVVTMGNAFYQDGVNENYVPSKMILYDVAFVTCSYGTFAALKQDGSLWTWGENERGQCGIGAFSAYVAEPVQIMEHISQVWTGVVATNRENDDIPMLDIVVAMDQNGNFTACGLGVGDLVEP